MAQYKLQNENLEITVNSKGAELVSIKEPVNNREYMWEGNPDVWGRVSPVLFPFVGGLKNKEYVYNGKSYPMAQHGFARDMEFTLVSQTENSIWFVLNSTEETLEKFPFDYRLEIGYEMSGWNIRVCWRVTNPSDKVLYFSIGGHPGFACPLDGYIGFDKAPEITSSVIDTTAGLMSNEKKTYPLEDGLLKITPDLFDQDALVIENNQVNTVSLLSADKTPFVSVSFDAPLFGVWSMPRRQAPYVCIEPWYGRCDHIDFHGSLEERAWGNSLEGGGIFEASYNIHIHPTL